MQTPLQEPLRSSYFGSNGGASQSLLLSTPYRDASTSSLSTVSSKTPADRDLMLIETLEKRKHRLLLEIGALVKLRNVLSDPNFEEKHRLHPITSSPTVMKTLKHAVAVSENESRNLPQGPSFHSPLLHPNKPVDVSMKESAQTGSMASINKKEKEVTVTGSLPAPGQDKALPLSDTAEETSDPIKSVDMHKYLTEYSAIKTQSHELTKVDQSVTNVVQIKPNAATPFLEPHPVVLAADSLKKDSGLQSLSRHDDDGPTNKSYTSASILAQTPLTPAVSFHASVFSLTPSPGDTNRGSSESSISPYLASSLSPPPSTRSEHPETIATTRAVLPSTETGKQNYPLTGGKTLEKSEKADAQQSTGFRPLSGTKRHDTTVPSITQQVIDSTRALLTAMLEAETIAASEVSPTEPLNPSTHLSTTSSNTSSRCSVQPTPVLSGPTISPSDPTCASANTSASTTATTANHSSDNPLTESLAKFDSAIDAGEEARLAAHSLFVSTRDNPREGHLPSAPSSITYERDELTLTHGLTNDTIPTSEPIINDSVLTITHTPGQYKPKRGASPMLKERMRALGNETERKLNALQREWATHQTVVDQKLQQQQHSQQREQPLRTNLLKEAHQSVAPVGDSPGMSPLESSRRRLTFASTSPRRHMGSDSTWTTGARHTAPLKERQPPMTLPSAQMLPIHSQTQGQKQLNGGAGKSDTYENRPYSAYIDADASTRNLLPFTTQWHTSQPSSTEVEEEADTTAVLTDCRRQLIFDSTAADTDGDQSQPIIKSACTTLSSFVVTASTDQHNTRVSTPVFVPSPVQDENEHPPDEGTSSSSHGKLELTRLTTTAVSGTVPSGLPPRTASRDRIIQRINSRKSIPGPLQGNTPNLASSTSSDSHSTLSVRASFSKTLDDNIVRTLSATQLSDSLDEPLTSTTITPLQQIPTHSLPHHSTMTSITTTKPIASSDYGYDCDHSNVKDSVLGIMTSRSHYTSKSRTKPSHTTSAPKGIRDKSGSFSARQTSNTIDTSFLASSPSVSARGRKSNPNVDESKLTSLPDSSPSTVHTISHPFDPLSTSTATRPHHSPSYPSSICLSARTHSSKGSRRTPSTEPSQPQTARVHTTTTTTTTTTTSLVPRRNNTFEPEQRPSTSRVATRAAKKRDEAIREALQSFQGCSLQQVAETGRALSISKLPSHLPPNFLHSPDPLSSTTNQLTSRPLVGLTPRKKAP